MIETNPVSGTDAPQKPPLPQGRTVPAGDGMKWTSEAFAIFKASPLMWIIFMICYMVASLAVAMVPFVGQLLLSLVSPMIMAGVMVGCRAIQNGDQMEIDHLTSGFSGKKTNPLLMLGAFYLGVTMLLVIVAVVLVIALVGTAALMNPEALAPETIGISMILSVLLVILIVMALALPLMMAYWFAVPLIQFHDMDAIQALKLSFKACLKNIVPFLVYGVAMLVVYLATALPLILSIFTLGPLIILGSLVTFGLMVLVAVPVTFASIYTSYKGVFEE